MNENLLFVLDSDSSVLVLETNSIPRALSFPKTFKAQGFLVLGIQSKILKFVVYFVASANLS